MIFSNIFGEQQMTTIMILNDFTRFGKVKEIFEIGENKDGLYEFLENVVMKPNIDGYGNGNGKMLQDLSDLYVLVALDDFPYDQIQPGHAFDLTRTTKNVLGYIWLCPDVLKCENCCPCHFINFIDSRISGLNIAEYMIAEYQEFRDGVELTYLFPEEIISGAAKYWKKYFMKKDHIKNKRELTQWMAEFNLDKKDLHWDELFLVFED